MSGARPSGTVTFLFTDIEGSTGLWEERPDEMQVALARHDEVLRSAIEASGGYVFATGGDGFAAAFHRPDDAVEAAVASQVALARQRGPAGVQLRVRMGIHTGSADERGGDYFGQTPTRAARIMAAAWGGQVLMSGVTSELIGRDRTIDLGVHRLRDLVDSVEIRQLVVDDLPRDFAPPRTASATVNNLPDQRTSFIGREELVGDIRDVFESSRLVTLVGVGGVGKTRLAVQTAAELLPRFADGVWLCELATASADAAVADVIVSALGIPHQPDRSVAASIVAFLRNREILVVLDNCEHVVDAAADLIEALLAGCPKTSVLVTSREALAVRGERIVAVPPLTVPESGSSQSASSVELFIERAVGRGVDPRDLTAASESIAEICRRLDGLPLAIELAAARTTSMSPTDILANLDHRFSLLTGGGTRRRDRRRTLEQTIEWSYALLDAQERAVFGRLGVIAASFDLETACSVGETAEVARGEVLDIVDSLVSQSLLVAESGPGGESRYRYLETIRHYAEGCVETAGQLNSASKVHARRLGEWMQRCAIQSVGPDEERWLAHLSLEVPNVGRAVDWAITEEPALVAAMLSPFASRVISVIDSVVPIAARAVKDWRSPQPPHYGVLVLAAEHSVATTEYAEAKRLAELAIERSNPDDFGAAQAHNVWQRANLQTAATAADYELGYQHTRAGIAWARQSNDKESLIHNLTGSIFSGLRAGHGPNRAAAEETHQLGIQSRCPSLVSVGAFILGVTLLAEGQPEAALGRFEECQAAAGPESYMGNTGSLFSAVAEVYLGEPRSALARVRDDMPLVLRQGNDYNVLFIGQIAAAALADLGQTAVAATIHGRTSNAPIDPGIADRLNTALGISAGDDNYEALINEGAALSVDALVELTLGTINDMLGSTP